MLQVDVVVNNMLAIVNTKLLKDYAAIDSRLMKLVFIVKHWAKRRQASSSSQVKSNKSSPASFCCQRSD